MNSFPDFKIGVPHLILDEVTSTNDYAMELISKSPPIEGTAISAAFQTAGRGQIGRIWEGEADKNIYTTIIFKPSFIRPSEQFLVNQAISVAVADFCNNALQKDVTIKWPNDIYVENKKIAGLLIQYIISGTVMTYGIAGIGINLKQENFSPDIPNPTSFYLESKVNYDIQAMRTQLFEYLDHGYKSLKSGSIKTIKTRYHELLFKLGKLSTFIIEEAPCYGYITGVDDQGKLKVKIDGNERTFNLHEIKMVIDNI